MGPNHRHKHTVSASRPVTTAEPHVSLCGWTLSAWHTTAGLLITPHLPLDYLKKKKWRHCKTLSMKRSIAVRIFQTFRDRGSNNFIFTQKAATDYGVIHQMSSHKPQGCVRPHFSHTVRTDSYAFMSIHTYALTEYTQEQYITSPTNWLQRLQRARKHPEVNRHKQNQTTAIYLMTSEDKHPTLTCCSCKVSFSTTANHKHDADVSKEVMFLHLLLIWIKKWVEGIKKSIWFQF